MRLQEINQYKDLFKEHLIDYASSGKTYEEGFKWDCIGTWQANFSTEDLDMSGAFAQSLKNDFSGRLWDGERLSGKSEMLHLIKQNPLLMRVTFNDLFDESKDIIMRWNRFEFHCDQVLTELHNKDDRFNNHKQSDHMISLYLSLQYPEIYGLYDYETFYKFMEKIESRNIPTEQEKDRYFKSLHAIYTVISKDIDFMNGVQFLNSQRSFKKKSLFLINDFMNFSVKIDL